VVKNRAEEPARGEALRYDPRLLISLWILAYRRLSVGIQVYGVIIGACSCAILDHARAYY
jgi:hypothetical protein